jgi:GNAT superfamily N-acetyltransferase
MSAALLYRLATPADIPHLGPLIEASIRGLQTHDYSSTQIEHAIGTWLGLDTQLVADQTYFVVEVPTGPGTSANPEHLPTIGNLAACGGWSRRKTPFGSDHRPNRDDSFLDPRTDAAKIRAFFVHPAWARRGIGSRILELCEQAAQAEGFTRFEMGATLTGIPLYRRHGYTEQERIELPLANGETLPIVRMTKQFRPG